MKCTLIHPCEQWQSWGSPKALVQKPFQPGKKCRNLTFSGKLLGCPFNTLVESQLPPLSDLSPWIFFYSRWQPFAIAVRSNAVFYICHKKPIWVFIRIVPKATNTIEWLHPTWHISLQLKIKYGCFYKVNTFPDIQDVMQLVEKEKWLSCTPL